jgi:dynein heavy chain
MKDDEIREYIRKRSKNEMEYVLGKSNGTDASSVAGSVNGGQIDGFTIPLNIFLYQEITRLNSTIIRVRNTLNDLRQAIKGEIIMTPELQGALNSVYNEKAPVHWYIDASGMEIAWILPSLTLWITGLIDREKQLTTWLLNTRPSTYWLTGFFNPQGFLTATRQEITRRHKADKWALDDVVLVATVTEYIDVKKIKNGPQEGIYIHGLYLEGCSWDRREGKLIESHAKELYTPLPVILITAMTSKQAEKLYGGKETLNYYDCPVYKQPKRTDKNYIFTIKLRTNVDPDHWALRGVALLCTKDT